MKIDKQTRTFAKQVQVDLLGLADKDLFQTFQHWTREGRASYVSQEVFNALGYTPSDHVNYSISTLHEGAEWAQWLAPTPQQLRSLLLDMPMPLFVQYVLPLAFESLHSLHPEWGEGATFNAHLANHLRTLVAKH